ncbi:hypothetical protein Tco_1230465, partial [Tanacetum coccineum]
MAKSNTEESAAGGDMLPSLMLADKSDDQLSRELFQLSNKCIREIRLPQAYGKICMSSCGWLLTLGEDFATQSSKARQNLARPVLQRRPAFCHFGDKRWTTHVEEADYDLLAVSAYIIGLDDDERKRLLLIVREGLND